MKKLKKLIATLLSFVMLCHVMPTQVYATVGQYMHMGSEAERLLEELAQQKQPDDAKELKIISEAEDRREEYAKHFRMEDGSLMAVQYKTPVHYKDGDEWVDIDNTLTPVQSTQENSASARTFSSAQTQQAYTNQQGDTSITFAGQAQAPSLVQMESDGHKISFGFGVLQAEAERLEAEQAIQKEAELEQSQTESVPEQAPEMSDESAATATPLPTPNATPTPNGEDANQSDNAAVQTQPNIEQNVAQNEAGKVQTEVQATATPEINTEEQEASPEQSAQLPSATPEPEEVQPQATPEPIEEAEIEESLPIKQMAEPAAVQAEVSNNAAAAITDGNELTLTEVQAHNNQFLKLDKLTSQCTYNNIFPGVDLRYTLSPAGIKEEIVLQNKEALKAFTFDFQLDGLQMRKTEDGSIEIFDPADPDTVINVIPAPYMYDSSDDIATSYAVEMELTDLSEGKYQLTITADEAWVNDNARVFPVVIDPIITTPKDRMRIHETYVTQEHPDQNKTTEAILRVGKGSTGLSRTYIKFDLPTLRSSDRVIDAVLELYPVSASWSNWSDHTPGTMMEVHEPLSPINTNTITWNNQPDYDPIVIDYEELDEYRLFQWDVTKLVNKWYDGQNNGLMIKYNNENTSFAAGFLFL